MDTFFEAVQDLLYAKTRAELDIASNVFVSEAKEARRQLKIRFESQALHVTATQTSSPKMEVSPNSILCLSLQS